jgi:hypothetical protein
MPPLLTLRSLHFAHIAYFCSAWFEPINSHHLSTQHSPTGPYDGSTMCSLRGKNWIFVYNIILQRVYITLTWNINYDENLTDYKENNCLFRGIWYLSLGYLRPSMCESAINEISKPMRMRSCGGGGGTGCVSERHAQLNTNCPLWGERLEYITMDDYCFVIIIIIIIIIIIRY